MLGPRGNCRVGCANSIRYREPEQHTLPPMPVRNYLIRKNLTGLPQKLRVASDLAELAFAAPRTPRGLFGRCAFDATNKPLQQAAEKQNDVPGPIPVRSPRDSVMFTSGFGYVHGQNEFFSSLPAPTDPRVFLPAAAKNPAIRVPARVSAAIACYRESATMRKQCAASGIANPSCIALPPANIIL